MLGSAATHHRVGHHPLDGGPDSFSRRLSAGNDLSDTERLRAGGDTGLIAAPRDEHHWLSVPQRLHHRAMARVANEEGGSFQYGRMRNRLLDSRVLRMAGKFRGLVFRSKRDQHADRLIGERLNGGLGEVDVVLPL